MMVIRNVKSTLYVSRSIFIRRITGSWRTHQVPLAEQATKPELLFDENGKLIAEFAELAPTGNTRMGANPSANGGLLLVDLKMPDFRDHAVAVPTPGNITAEATSVMGEF